MAVKDIYTAVVTLDHKHVEVLVRKELEEGSDIAAILDDGLIAGMDDLGRQFAEGLLFVPEMLIGAMAVKNGLNVLKPLLVETKAPQKGTIVIGTVKGDQHDVGKNLVGMLLEGGGFKVIDIGVNRDTAAFLTAVRKHHADIVALSCLLTTCMPMMKKMVAEIKQAVPGIKIMVGGAPVSREFAESIGADGYGVSGPRSVEEARRLIEG